MNGARAKLIAAPKKCRRRRDQGGGGRRHRLCETPAQHRFRRKGVQKDTGDIVGIGDGGRDLPKAAIRSFRLFLDCRCDEPGGRRFAVFFGQGGADEDDPAFECLSKRFRIGLRAFQYIDQPIGGDDGFGMAGRGQNDLAGHFLRARAKQGRGGQANIVVSIVRLTDRPNRAVDLVRGRLAIHAAQRRRIVPQGGEIVARRIAARGPAQHDFVAVAVQ
ncbi:MAG: hypothetical protein OXT01_21685 [Rhodospirillaceae bacterium]|nr:hypothetical protein [Rhodospirillaceae bacterium]